MRSSGIQREHPKKKERTIFISVSPKTYSEIRN